MKRVLVTGASGFVGRASLAPLLARGYEVHGVSFGRAGPPIDGVCWHRADLLDANATTALCRSIAATHLLHFAWYAVPGRFWRALENFGWVRASLSLLEAFRASGGQRAVLAGTCAEYAWTGAPCDEQITPLDPATTYGVCKRSTGALAQAFAQETGLSLAWGRIFFPYGPGEYEERLTSYVVRSLLSGQAAECTAGTQVRDLIYIDDLGDAFAALLDSPVEGSVNVASGIAMPLADFLTDIAQRSGRPELLRLGARPMPAGEAVAVTAAVDRLHREVGWFPRTGLSEGIERTIAHWRGEVLRS